MDCKSVNFKRPKRDNEVTLEVVGEKKSSPHSVNKVSGDENGVTEKGQTLKTKEDPPPTQSTPGTVVTPGTKPAGPGGTDSTNPPTQPPTPAPTPAPAPKPDGNPSGIPLFSKFISNLLVDNSVTVYIQI